MDLNLSPHSPSPQNKAKKYFSELNIHNPRWSALAALASPRPKPTQAKKQPRFFKISKTPIARKRLKYFQNTQ